MNAPSSATESDGELVLIKWVIDTSQMVHVSICVGAGAKPTWYFPQRIARDDAGKPKLEPVTDVDQMIVHLAGKDSSGGMVQHSGPHMLKSCPVCLS